jgi:tetratricopeptide (TPR) repeat protein
MADGISALVDRVPLLGLGYKHLDERFRRGEEWWDKRARPLLQALDGLGADKIAMLLPRCLGADLQDAIADLPRVPIAVIGDTAEAFHGGKGFTSGIGAFHNDAWLRELVWHSPGVLFVLLGRDPLEWHRHEGSPARDWRKIVKERRMAPLADEEALRLLERFPVPERPIRERMVEAAEGLPFYLGLQLDLYLDYVGGGGEAPVEAFGDTHDPVVTWFLSHLDQRVERSLVTLAHARRFDEDLYHHLREARPAIVSDVRFGELMRFSFVESVEAETWRLHQLMRDILQSRLAQDDAAEWESIHKALFDYWDERCRPTDVREVERGHELALGEAAFHRAAFEGATFGDWAAERGRPLFESARYGFAQRLFEAALASEKAALPADDPRLARTLSWLGIILRQKGDVVGAQRYQERVLAILERALGPDHPEVAITLSNLSNVEEKLGARAAARERRVRALAIFRSRLGERHPHTDTVRRALEAMDNGGKAADAGG